MWKLIKERNQMKRNAKEGKERHRIEDEMRLRFK